MPPRVEKLVAIITANNVHSESHCKQTKEKGSAFVKKSIRQLT